MTRDVNEVVEELNSLSTAEIAELMRGKSIKATPGVWCECAIALYVRQETGVDVGVTSDTVMLKDGTVFRDDLPDLPLNWEVTTFIFNYDDLIYPELIKEEWLEAYSDA